jgi:polar amino acid transport system substrate-binding protein
MLNYLLITQNMNPSSVKHNPLARVLSFILSAVQRITLPFFLVASFSLVTTAQAEVPHEKLTVTYQSNGTQHTFQGIKTPLGYRFNEKSNKIINLATLHWAPYISEELCNKGWIFQFTVAILVSKGYQVNIHFYPWPRAVMLVELGTMDVLLPVYFIESSTPSVALIGKTRRELLALSNQFTGGEVSFQKRKGDPFTLQEDLANLKGKTIGVLRNFINTPEFDAMIDSKQFTTVEAIDELQLIKLLVAKRVDLIIGDPTVFTYSVNYSNLSNQNKQALLDSIEKVTPVLDYKPLYFAVSKKSSQLQQITMDLNDAIADFEKEGEIDRLIQLGSDCIVDY